MLPPHDSLGPIDGKCTTHSEEETRHYPGFAEDRSFLVERDSASDGAYKPPSPNTSLHFSDYASDYGRILSSTPVAVPSNFRLSSELENSTAQLRSQNAKLSELECQLRHQTTINKELKRLLVASMGSDLQYRLNQIAEEKATMAQSLDTSLHRLAENGEEIDRVSIECDIWRSKFLASRLMVDELAGWKAEVTRQLRESQRALQCLLKESAELGNALHQCNHHLNGVVNHLNLSEDDHGML